MNPRALPFIALILGACAIGFVPNLVRLADTGPAAAGFWRMALALPILLPALSLGGPTSPWRTPLAYWWAAKRGRY